MSSKTTYKSTYTSLVVAAIFALLTFVVSFNNLFPSFEHLLYDRVLRLQPKSAPSDIVIIAMDEKSLQKYGPLPWPRQLHAQLVNKLTKAEVKVIGFDVLFDKKRDTNDQELAEAVKKNGRVVFPVIIEQVSLTGELIELMPYPELTQVAAKLGLVHFELSEDNIARSTYLRAGLGEPYWRSFAAEMLEITNGEQDYQLPFELADHQPSFDLTKIERLALVHIPFKQARNHFQKISFVDVLESDNYLNQLRNKVVLVGVTATAARNADFLPVPVSRDGQPMPGVEINATLYEALSNETFIQRVPNWLAATVGALLVFLFFNLLPKLTPRSSFYYLIVFLLVTTLIAWWLLHYQYRWLSIDGPIAVILGGYLIWIWRKIVANMVFFKTTLERLNIETENSVQISKPGDLKTKLGFLLNLKLVKKRQVESTNLEQGDLSDSEFKAYLLQTLGKDLSIADNRLLGNLLQDLKGEQIQEEWTEYGLIESRIKKVEAAIQQINFLRRFIEQTMDRMSDGIILADTDGQVFYSNLLAKNYIPELREDESLTLQKVLSEVRLINNQQWHHELKKLLDEGVGGELLAISSLGLDLRISLSLLKNVAHRDFIIINLIDVSALKREQRRQLEMIDFISHDLRSPMTSILALLSRYNRNPKEFDGQQMSQDIEKLTRSSLSLAEHFLMLSRAESHVEIPLYPIELLHTIDNAIAVILPQARAKGIEVDFDFTAYEDIFLNANQDLLERVLTNLLSNAIKYSPGDSMVSIQIEQDTNELRVNVLDQGDGIDPEQMDSIFKPFTRMQKHEMEKVKGIGLGLRFVRASMIRFGGSVKVSSEAGKGSCFTLSFPHDIILENELDD